MSTRGVTVQAIIWDLGGVLVRTTDQSWRESWERRLGLGPGGLAQQVFEGPQGWEAQLGRATVARVWESLAERFQLSDPQIRQLQSDFWRGDELNMALLDYIRNKRGRVKMGLLSNAWKSLRQYLEDEWKIAALFDAIIISAEHGICKPDPGIYRLAVKSLEVDPSRAVFVDDMAENVAAARTQGLQAIRYRTNEQTLAALQDALGPS